LFKQIIYVFVVLVTIAGIMAFTKEKVKNIFAVAIFLTPFQGGLWVEGLHLDILMSNILMLGLGVFVFFTGRDRNPGQKLYLPIFIPYLGMLICGIISSLGARNVIMARSGVYMILERYLVFFCVYNIIRKPEDLKFIIYPFTLSVLFESLLGVIQFRIPSFTIGVIDAAHSFQVWRAHGTLFHPNAFGMYLMLVLPVIFQFLLLAYRAGKKKRLYLYSTTFILGFGGLFASQSRGAWAGFGLGMIIVFLLNFSGNKGKMRNTIRKSIIPLALIAVLFSLKYGSTFVNRIDSNEFNKDYEGRVYLENQAKELIKEYPVFGVGWGNYLEYIDVEFVHNLYLLILAELGYTGLFFFLTIMFIWAQHLYRGRKSDNLFVRNIAFGIIATFMAFILASIPGPDYLIARQMGTVVWMLIGVACVIPGLGQKYSRKVIDQYALKNKIDEEYKNKIVKNLNDKWASSI